MFNLSVLQSYGVLGNRNYELTDHRGNVQTVINDIKYPLSSDNTSIDSYEVGISSVADYSPFGAPLDGRTIDNIFHHPSQNNGSQTPADTVEIYNNNFDNPPATGSPYYSTEVTLDAHLSNTNWTSSAGTFTNYNSSGAGSGKSIAITTASADTAYLTLTMDVDSGYELDITSYSFAHRSSATGYDSYTLIVNGVEIGSGSIYVASSGSTLQSTGVVDVSNPISGQTGTVGVVLKLYGGTHGHSGTFRMDDFVLNGFVREENSGYSSSDYFVSRNHRYSFQNQEKHDEVRRKGNYINYKYRGYDPRVGRLDWLIDPLAPQYPHYTPYQFSGNKLIHAIELEGLEEVELNSGEKVATGPRSIESTIDLLESMGTWDNGQYVTEWGDGAIGLEEISVAGYRDNSNTPPMNLKDKNFDFFLKSPSNLSDRFSFGVDESYESYLNSPWYLKPFISDPSVKGGVGIEGLLFGGGSVKGLSWVISLVSGASDFASQTAFKGGVENVNAMQTIGATLGGRFKGSNELGAIVGGTLDWKPFSSNPSHQSIDFSRKRGQSTSQMFFNIGVTYGISQVYRLPHNSIIERGITTSYSTFMGQGISGLAGDDGPIK